MKLYKGVFLIILLIFMAGCFDKTNTNDDQNNNNDDPINNDDPNNNDDDPNNNDDDPNNNDDNTVVSEETLKVVIENYEFDVNYPYAFDFFVKEIMSNVDGIEDYYFDMIEPTQLVVGENNIVLKVIFPDKSEEQYNITLNTYEVDQQYNIEDFIFNKETNTIEGYVGIESEISIPEVIDGELVLKIKEEAFKGKNIVCVYLPITLTEIGDYAFADNYLEKVVIPKFVTYVGDYAFANCRLFEIEIKSLTIDFGSLPFDGNDQYIENVNLDEVGNQESLIENWFLLGLPVSLIPGIQLKNNIYYLGETKTLYGFNAKPNDSLELPNLVKELGVEKIANYAFYNNENNEDMLNGEYSFGDSIKTIGKYAFADHEFLFLDLPEGLVNIEEFAFSNSLVEHLNISSSVINIEDNVFLNVNPTKIIVDGNEIRFNDNWEAIGLPIGLKPLVRDQITSIYSLKGENEDHLTKTLQVDGVVYGIGYSWSKEGDFENESSSPIIPFLMKYDLNNSQGHHKLLVNDYESDIIDFVYLGEGIFIGCGYKVINGEVTPYIFKFNTNLELVEEFQIHDPNMRIIINIAVNDNNEIAIVSENKNDLYDIYDIIIYNTDFEELYRYQIKEGMKKLLIIDLVNDGDGFVAVGSTNDPNATNYNDSASIDSIIIKLNKNGVLWEKVFNEEYYQELNSIYKENNIYHIFGLWEYNNGLSHSEYLLKVDNDGNIIETIVFKDFGFSNRFNDIQTNDKIYIFGIENYSTNYSNIYVFDQEYNFLEKLEFLDNTTNVVGAYYYNNKAYLFITSRDSYIDNNATGDNIYLINWTLS